MIRKIHLMSIAWFSVAAFAGHQNVDFKNCENILNPPTVSEASLSIALMMDPSHHEIALHKLHRRHGAVFKTESGDEWFIADPSLIEDVAKNTEDVSRNWQDLKDYIGNSFFIYENFDPSENSAWRAVSKALSTGLKPGSVLERSSQMKKAVSTTLDRYLKGADLNEISFEEFGFYLAYSSAMRFLFNYTPSTREVDLVRKKADGVFDPSNANRLKTMGKYLEEVAQQIENHGEFQAAPDSIYAALKRTQMEMFKTDSNFNDQWLRDQVKTLIWASFETTQSAIGVVLWFAGRYPQYAERVRQSYLSLQGQPAEKDPTILSFINEALRLYPPVWNFPRRALRDFKLDNYLVPQGALIYLNIYSAQRLSAIWGPDANLFRPDRVDAADCSMDKTKAMVAFGEGPRRCIGKYVALGELSYALGEILARFELKVSKGFPFRYVGTLRPEFDGKLRLRPRQP